MDAPWPYPTPPLDSLGPGIFFAAELDQVKREAEALEARSSRKKFQDFESTAVFARHKHEIVKVDRVDQSSNPVDAPQFSFITRAVS
jgi:hypothetical protein